MKAKIISKILFLFICLCAFASASVAQEKPQALRVDKYSDLTENSKQLMERLGKFTDRLSKEPTTTKGYIFLMAGDEQIEKVTAILSERTDLKDRIIFDGRETFREFINIEFYLVPEGAEMPYQVCGLKACECPRITIFEFDDAKTGNLTFAISLGGTMKEVSANYKYQWTVSAGRIIEGQGTPVIEVKPEGAKEIKATIEIYGMCDECPREATFTTKIQ